MLSTIAIVSIFIEIFACGLLASAFFAFIKKFFSSKQPKDLYLGLSFLSFSVYIGLALLSQMLYNLDRPIANLIFIQKIIACNFILGSLFVFVFIRYKFTAKLLSPIIFLYSFASLFFIGRIAISSTTLLYRPDVIEPIVNFSMPTPSRSLWLLSFFVLALFSFFALFKKQEKPKAPLAYLFLSSSIILASLLCTVAYANTSNNYFLLISWALNLLGSFGILIAEIMPEGSPLSSRPISFLRSRLLFKLVAIFVVLIVILFEITTLATLTLSKQALKTSIFSTYLEAAQNLSYRIQSLTTLEAPQIQMHVSQSKIGRQGILYVVDKNGKLIAHPDRARLSLALNLKGLSQVKKALSGLSGAEEFAPNEFGESLVGAYSPIKKFGGAVIAEESLSSAFYDLRELETNSLVFIIAGIILTVLAGLIFAQSIEMPIKKLTQGTEELAKNNLNYNIDISSIDEIGMLAKAFNKMTQELKDSQQRLILSEKLASLGTMAAGMAHEIKNPLVSLRTFSQLLEQKWDDKTFRDKFSQIVPTEIERINKIAESLLKFGRPIKAEMGKVNINSLLEEILILFESECKKNGIRLATKFADLPDITGNSQQISQALVNIILNAIQAMEGHGGELIIKTDVGEVIKTGPDSKKIAIKSIFIEVTDTGPGIPQENIKSLFDPFFTTKDRGTGMGLPITLRIIEEHKGSIKVKSEIGKGTTFVITLPENLEDF